MVDIRSPIIAATACADIFLFLSPDHNGGGVSCFAAAGCLHAPASGLSFGKGGCFNSPGQETFQDLQRQNSTTCLVLPSFLCFESYSQSSRNNLNKMY